MSIGRITFFAAIVLALSASLASADPFVLDGIKDANYSNSFVQSWYNGHQTSNSVYGDATTPLGTTTIHWEVGTLSGGGATQYMFLYVDVPLAAKNMIWDKNAIGKPVANINPLTGLTEADIAPYRPHHETHHSPGSLKLDFKTATGSEKLVVGGFKANLDGDADSGFGVVGYKDSVDYLFDNGLATMDLSLNRTTPMAFEFQVDLSKAQAFLDLFSNNTLEFHLSPERQGSTIIPPPPQTPEPATLLLLATAGAFALVRRRK